MNFSQRIMSSCMSLALTTGVVALAVAPVLAGDRATASPNARLGQQEQGELPLSRIWYWIDKHRGAEARRLIDKVKITPANSNRMHTLRGLAFRADREPELAVQEFDKCTKFEGRGDSLSLIAGSYSQVERYEKAIEILDHAIAVAPNADLYAQRADYRCAMGKWEAAVPDYKTAASFNSDRKRTYLSVGAEVLRRQGKVKEAIALLDSGVNFPERLSDAKFWLCRAQCFDQLQQWSEGEKNCNQALRIAQKGVAKGRAEEEVLLSHVLLERAKCYEHQGKKALAEADRKAHLRYSSDTADELMGSRY
ncbi:MAG: tetratricopeptide repeat protein [Cyanobacteria bacterium SZAS LIN-2]|nr:tetratricopeptide repeat protein [Cyanobacteria bacterium SZAS LIN-2]